MQLPMSTLPLTLNAREFIKRSICTVSFSLGTSERYKQILSTVGFELATPQGPRLQVDRHNHSATTRLI